MSKFLLDSTKLAWHRERVEAYLAGERVAPVTIDCSISTACQLHCVFCYAALQNSGPKQNMPRDAIMRFLDDAAEIGVKGISFVSDGESTCNPHVYEAIMRGKANGLDMAMGTNGLLLREERLEDILPCLTYLRFNLNAADSASYGEIHGCRPEWFDTVVSIIQKCVRVKRERGLSVTLGLQMVLMPHYANQILPLARLGRELGVDYLVIKHCSDDELGTLRKKFGFHYLQYMDLVPLLQQAEALSTPLYQVTAKWSKILSEGKRRYTHCYGPPLLAQFSGTGLCAPCGMLYPARFQEFHIGNLVQDSFKKLWQGERYWEVMAKLATEINPQVFCGTMCVQHLSNEALWDIREGRAVLAEPEGPPPAHVNFL